jgi:MFS family permease
MGRFGRRVIHTGLVIEAAGLLAIIAVLHATAAGVGTLDLLVPMAVGGMGMGMVFVPLFDIVMAGVRPHEMGSASGVIQATNGLAMSIGVGGLGAVFFGLVGAKVGGAGGFVHAAEWTSLLTVALLAGAFVIAFRLPRQAQQFEATEVVPHDEQSPLSDAVPAYASEVDERVLATL